MITSDSPAVEQLLGPAEEAVLTLETAALEMRGIERSWGERRILTGVDLTIPRGTVAWLGGPNGAGKTTLLRVAAGILLPDRGSVALCGLDPERQRRQYHRRLGFLSAGDRGLYARLTVRQNLDIAARLFHVPRREHAAALERTIERFSLHELAARRVDRISMGQRQRVRIAMTFIHDPDLALLDEPHTSLDDEALGLLESAMIECCVRGGSVLWCSPASRDLPLPANVRHTMVDGRVSQE